MGNFSPNVPQIQQKFKVVQQQHRVAIMAFQTIFQFRYRVVDWIMVNLLKSLFCEIVQRIYIPAVDINNHGTTVGVQSVVRHLDSRACFTHTSNATDENTFAIVLWTEVSANGIAFLDTTDKMRYCFREMGKISARSCETNVTLLITNSRRTGQILRYLSRLRELYLRF